MTARQILAANGVFRQPGCNDNPHTGQRISKKLAIRRADYERTVNNDPRKDYSGYHIPGSHK